MLAKRLTSSMPMATRMFASNKSAIFALSSRTFSSFEQVSRGAAKLGKALEKEIKYENENYT